jgi:CrcB protein
VNPALVVALALAGGVGAGARYLVDRLLSPAAGGFPLGILIVNISGSFALGLLTAFAALVAPEFAVVAGAGFLGGYTTFSAVSVETVLLAERRRWRDAVGNVLGTLVLAVAAAAGGIALGEWITGALPG